jgi:hypothetical protein
VPIKRSSAHEIATLLADLASGSPIARQTAQARLAVIGSRAVDRLMSLAESDQPREIRAAAFHTLEAIADPRALDAAVRAMRDPDATVAVAAVGAARTFLRGPSGSQVVDELTAVALDRSAAAEPVRVAAVAALRELERRTVEPLLKALASDPSPAVREAARALSKPRSRSAKRAATRRGDDVAAPAAAGGAAPADRTDVVAPAEAIVVAAERGLPDDPWMMRHALTAGGRDVPLPVLLRIVERLREKEADNPGRAAEWAAARAAAHAALAVRGSRLGLYDLRESLAADRQPLPVEFLTALTAIGDASCLEAIASARARSRDGWFRDRIGDAFRAIVARERLTRRHAVVRKVEKKWPGALDDLWSGPSLPQ